MARINNSDLTKETIEGAKINIVVDDVPSELGKTVVPTMEVNPRLLKTINYFTTTNKSTTGDLVSPTFSKQLYVTNINIDYVKDAASDNIVMELKVPFEGQNKVIQSINTATTTALKDKLNIVFNVPLKLTKGGVMVLTGGFTAGTLVRSLNVQGYVIED